MTQPTTHERGRQALRSACQVLFTILISLAAIEIALRVVDLRVLREAAGERSLSYHYDAELGWAPTPNSSAPVTTARTIQAKHNSLGFRDIEFAPGARPTMLFMGDSFVWGVDAEADERFTDLLRGRIPDLAIVNAGVSGFGTDQEYLLLQRIWPKIEPKVVVTSSLAEEAKRQVAAYLEGTTPTSTSPGRCRPRAVIRRRYLTQRCFPARRCR